MKPCTNYIFIFRPFFGIETLSWMCILGAIPFAVLGFVKYNNMPIENFIKAWIKSEILMPKHLTFKSENIYALSLKPVYEKIKKEGMKVDNK